MMVLRNFTPSTTIASTIALLFCKCIPLLKVLLHVPRRYALPLPFRDVYSATAVIFINGLSYGSHVVRPYADSLIPSHASYYSRRPVYRVTSRTNMPQGIVIVVAALLFPYLLFFCVYQTVNPLDHIHEIKICYWDTFLERCVGFYIYGLLVTAA